MDIDKDRDVGPLCKFGPGGDFISVWPKEPAGFYEQEGNSLARLLDSIGQIMTAMLGSEFEMSSALSSRNYHLTDHILLEKEKLEYAASNNKADERTYTASTSIIESNRRFQGEPMLFADDCRISLRTGHKPKHRIRTHHRIAKKRPTVILPGQGSLFETDFKSAKTA